MKKDFRFLKVGNGKTGNGLREDMMKQDGYAKEVKTSATYEAIARQPWKVYDILGVGDSELREIAFDLVSKKYGMTYDDIYNAWLKRKWPEGSYWGNKKVGNKAIVLKDGDVWVVLYANETKSKEFETEAEARKFADKVGNESIDKQEWSMFNGLRKDAEKELGNSTVSEYNAEIQRLTKKAEQLRRMGQGRSAMEIEKQIEKLGKELRELGNKKTGNESPEEMEVKYKGYTITYFPYQKKYMVRHPNEVSGLVQKHFTSVDEAKKAIDKKSIGNEETKAERKFGKVRGEFEEGALKTPQGKTVTDPAQAKAIAYSEADKVDNLKRARNAMKK